MRSAHRRLNDRHRRYAFVCTVRCTASARPSTLVSTPPPISQAVGSAPRHARVASRSPVASSCALLDLALHLYYGHSRLRYGDVEAWSCPTIVPPVPLDGCQVCSATSGRVHGRLPRGRSWSISRPPAEGRPGKAAGGETLIFEPEDVLVETTSAEGYARAEEDGWRQAYPDSAFRVVHRENYLDFITASASHRPAAGHAAPSESRKRLSRASR